MNPQLNEIDEIPQVAKEFIRSSPDYILPRGIPYLGMGSSYFAPLAFVYMGIDIMPHLASEYHYYLHGKGLSDQAVILSQSGESSESLWCTGYFEEFTGITNNSNSNLARHPRSQKTILLHAGDEKFSSSKTYVNTLLALFRGFGFSTEKAVMLLEGKIAEYRELGKKLADEIYRKITAERIHGIYITGSGPNIATAMEASLILSETTKLCFTGMPMAQYDHGPKETSAGSIVIQILSQGASRGRSLELAEKISRAGAHVITVEEKDMEEYLSVIGNIVPFNYLAAYLAEKLEITDTFAIGGKITRV